LINRVNANDVNVSNYVLSSSNNLINKIIEYDTNISNYILTTSNNLILNAEYNDTKISLLCNTIIAIDIVNDNNMSNYVLSTSNLLSERLRVLDQLTSNVVNNSISTLNIEVNANNTNVSNYVLSTSNLLSERLRVLDQLTSNVVNNSISTLNIEVNANNTNVSNYVLSTSNLISRRITDLTTDMITENINASKKFIVNNSYNDDLTLNGTLTINSNLIVLGDTTQLDTIVYTTERLEIMNANNTTTALMIQQNTNDRDIFIASNVNTAVFKIANNGDVLINGVGNYKKNNRDVILDTSNYVFATSNNLINYVITSSNTLINKANFNNVNVSNYVFATSNNLINYVLTSSNTLINKANFNDTNMSNYVFETSNMISTRITDLTTNMITEPANATNRFIVNNLYNNNLVLNGTLTINSNLIVLGDKDASTTTKISMLCNTLIAIGRLNDANVSNYVLSTSNILSERMYILDQLTSNVVNNSTLNIDVGVNDNNVSNYVLNTSNTITSRITNLTTDMIIQPTNATKRFIVNNSYNNNLEVNGNLTINSNLIVLGDSTQLNTIVYNTERLEIVNGNNTTTALMVQQNTANRDIFVASNISTNVFKIANNGDVLMNGTLTAANIAGAGASVTALNMANASSGTLTVARGGTGASTLTAGQVLIGNTTSALLQTANLTWDVANNRLGVRTATPATSLHVVGEIVATNNITSYYSDDRLKTKIADIHEPLKIINNLNGFYYIPNELARINGITNTDKEIGLSAQEVQRVLPEIVKLAPFDLATNDEGKKISKSGENYLTMSYERLAPVFVEAIKELEQKNNVLEQKNNELTDKYNKLLEDITIIKKRLLIEP
jgi:hypothetical protein